MRRKARKDFSEIEVISGNRLVDLSGRGELVCPLLDASGRYVGFNGNKKRRGCGYLLMSEAGWLSRAGRNLAELELFLQDLSQLSLQLGLVVVGLLARSGTVRSLNLEQIRALANSATSGLLQRLHLRVYAPEDYVSRWDQFFRWSPDDPVIDEAGLDRRAELEALLRRHQVKRKISPRLWERIRPRSRRSSMASVTAVRSSLRLLGSTSRKFLFKRPLSRRHRSHDLAQRPQAPVCWQPRWDTWDKVGPLFRSDLERRGLTSSGSSSKNRRPTKQQVKDWWRAFPDAGIAVICGSLSGILVVDVDGNDARDVLIRKLGSEPLAPKVLSGSGDPNRFHLFFQHPDFTTRAKKTPWHQKLEFRGHAGLVVLPPSLHKSGNLYRWAPGRSLSDLAIPVLPGAIAEAIRPVCRLASVEPAVLGGASELKVGPSTAAFLAGKFADGPNWNDRLFQAACDSRGRGIPLSVAMPQLLHGARPWNDEEREAAVRTIESAYSSPRSPAVV